MTRTRLNDDNHIKNTCCDIREIDNIFIVYILNTKTGAKMLAHTDNYAKATMAVPLLCEKFQCYSSSDTIAFWFDYEDIWKNAPPI